jgi:hypothetical protein
MAGFEKVRLSSPGLSVVLTNSAVTNAVTDAASRIALAAEGSYPKPHTGHVTVEVEEYVNTSIQGSRAAARVVAKHAAALGFEAKHGTLLRAAASSGLEVKAS